MRSSYLLGYFFSVVVTYVVNLKFKTTPSLFPVSKIPSHDYKATVHLRTKLRSAISGTMKSMHFNCSTGLPPLFVSQIVLTSYLAGGVGTKHSELR